LSLFTIFFQHQRYIILFMYFPFMMTTQCSVEFKEIFRSLTHTLFSHKATKKRIIRLRSDACFILYINEKNFDYVVYLVNFFLQGIIALFGLVWKKFYYMLKMNRQKITFSFASLKFINIFSIHIKWLVLSCLIERHVFYYIIIKTTCEVCLPSSCYKN